MNVSEDRPAENHRGCNDEMARLRQTIAELEAGLAAIKLAHSGLSNGNYSLRKELAAAQAEVKRLQAECMQLRKGIDGYCTCNRLLAVDCPVHDK